MAIRHEMAGLLRQNRWTARSFRTVRAAQLRRSGESMWLRRITVAGSRSIDVGANVGAMTAVLASAVGSSGQVVALEPNPECYRLLRLGAARCVMPIEMALGRESGSGKLLIPKESDGSPSHQLGTLAHGFSAGTFCEVVDIQLTTLDDVYRLSRLPVSSIKIDVEGLELDVLNGGTTILEHERPALVIEIEARHQPPGQDVSAVFSVLSAAGYAIWGIETDGLLPLEKFDAHVHQVLSGTGQRPRTPYVNNFLAIHLSDERRSGVAAAHVARG